MHMWQLVPVQKRKCGNCAWQSSVPLTCWRVGSHLLHPRGILRPLYKGFWELLGALSRQEPLELREKLGQGLFGEVFFTRSALAAHVFTMFSQCLDQLKRCVAKKPSWTMRWFLFFHHGHWPRIWPGGGGKGSSLLGASASWADPVRWISARVPPSFRAYLLRISFTFIFWLSKIPRGLLVFCDFSGCFVVSSIYLCCSWPFSWSGHRTWEPREALRKAWFRFVVALRGGHLLAKCHAKPGYRPTCTGASWRILYFCSSGFEDGWDMLRWSWCIMSHVFGASSSTGGIGDDLPHGGEPCGLGPALRGHHFGYPRQPGSFDLAGRFHAPGRVPLLQSVSNQMLWFLELDRMLGLKDWRNRA